MNNIPLFQKGNFTLASGALSNWKIECDALSEADWEGLAEIFISLNSWSFGQVIGVPRGGIPFANALKKYIHNGSDRILVVDDVWTTGGSMKRFIENEVHQKLTNYNYFFAVVFARNPVPDGVTALFTMPSR